MNAWIRIIGAETPCWSCPGTVRARHQQDERKALRITVTQQLLARADEIS
jgi:hypothetical protein